MDGGWSNVEDGEQGTTDVVALGDVITVKPRGGSWWPAVVVDENTISKSARPGKKPAGNVCVRLYGSHECLYVDPIKCRSGFEKILKKHKGSYRDIFQQALEEALPSSKTSKSKHSGSKTKGLFTDNDKAKRPKKSNTAQNIEDSINEIEELDDSIDVSSQSPVTEKTSKGKSPFSGMLELSERRMRVMAKLGLTAPPGSPFL